jgi:hypothetical protein
VKSLLGLVGYYQRFIPGFATLASPLNDLTRKALPDPIITPDFASPLLVHTDALEVGLGGVLSQVRAREEHPISRKLLLNERNYSTVKKEALAIKWTLDKLRYYLLGREFTLVTDRAPRKWMASAQDTKARVTRWFLALQDFQFKVDHRLGREHANADALSRRDTCLGGFPIYQRPKQAVKECGIPLLKPRPGWVRGIVMGGVYRRHPLTGDREHHFSPPNQRDRGHLSGGGKRPGSCLKRSTRTDEREEREPVARRMRSRPRWTRGSRRP